MKHLIYAVLFVSVTQAHAQDIPPKATMIVVTNISFKEVAEKILDKGYTIEIRDADLQTLRTDPIVYPRYWNGAYKIQVRMKDSTAIFSGVYQCPYETSFTSILLKQPIQKGNWTRVFNRTNKKGVPQAKSMEGYPFHLIAEFAKSFGKEVVYKTE